MGNGKFLQFLTLLLCLCFRYFTYKAYSDVQQVKEENAILRETLDSLLGGSTMTSPDAEPDPLSAASSISAFMDELITDAQRIPRRQEGQCQRAVEDSGEVLLSDGGQICRIPCRRP